MLRADGQAGAGDGGGVRHRPGDRRRPGRGRGARSTSATSTRRRSPPCARRCPSVGTTLADVADDAAVDRLFAEAQRAARRARRAGQQRRHRRARPAAIEDIDPADWRRCLEIDLTGLFLCARRAVPLLKAAGGGAMVNMSSAAGRFGYAFRTPYAAAKWGVIGLTQSLPRSSGPTASPSTPSCPASSRARAWRA